MTSQKYSFLVFAIVLVVSMTMAPAYATLSWDPKVIRGQKLEITLSNPASSTEHGGIKEIIVIGIGAGPKKTDVIELDAKLDCDLTYPLVIGKNHWTHHEHKIIVILCDSSSTTVTLKVDTLGQVKQI